MNVYFITAIVLALYLVFAWMVGPFLRFQGTALWVLRGGLVLIGVAAAGFFLWFYRRLRRRQTYAVSPSAAGDPESIAILFRQADRKIRKSKKRALNTFPLVFVLGESNSAKTSVILNSGMEAELLAGQVSRDADLVSTAVANFWFARDAIFIEAGGAVCASRPMWMRLQQLTTPGRFSVALAGGHQAPRAAVVCLNCERISESQTASQNLGNRLREMAQSLGAAFPVYALFTKLDRLPCFTQFVAGLNAEEASQILGATLPRGRVDGVFAEEESRRLARAFDQIIYSLAERRLDYLGRETVVADRPDIYEFPRELSKLRNQAVQMLVEITRPTQLNANAFLRGFYLSGVRPVVVNEAVLTGAKAAASAPGGSGATRFFSLAERDVQAQSAPAQSVRSRKVPEWTFLSHLFTDVVLRDRIAFSDSHRSSRVDTLRRWLLVAAAALVLFFAGALLGSFARNRGLQTEVEQAAAGLDSAQTSGVSDLERLRKLDQLRNSAALLSRYNRLGAPLSYRWGLYSGDALYPSARGIYFKYFRRMLLAPTQEQMVPVLKSPPATQTSGDFQTMYRTLKAYLITTSNHEHADWDSLVTTFLEYCPAWKTADAEKRELMRRQFDFYASELAAANPYGPENDTQAVESARAYLKPFNTKVIYQAMLDDAARGRKPVNFNRMFPGSAQVVQGGYEVPAAFTRESFTVMRNSLRNPDKFRAEEWVLGAPAGPRDLSGSLRDELTSLYLSDYTDHWRAYLQKSRVVGYGGVQDASQKLSKLIAGDSPLLQLLEVAQENISVETYDARVFGAVQAVARESTREKLVTPSNQGYMDALISLQGAVRDFAANQNDLSLMTRAQEAASNARRVVNSIALNFTADTQGGVHKEVGRLLVEPIDDADAAVKRAGGAGAESICKIVNPVTSKRPFNPSSAQQATLEEVQDLFRPQQGLLWTLVQGKLATSVAHQGTMYVNIGPAPQSQNFLTFLGNAQQFADALFPGGSPGVRLSFTLRQLPSGGIDQATLVIDGQTLSDAGRSQQFVWQGGSSSVNLSVMKSGEKGAARYQGQWAIFDFFSAAQWNGTNPAAVEWLLESNGMRLANQTVSEGSKALIRYELTTQGAPVFKKQFLSGLHCSVR